MGLLDDLVTKTKGELDAKFDLIFKDLEDIKKNQKMILENQKQILKKLK